MNTDKVVSLFCDYVNVGMEADTKYWNDSSKVLFNKIELTANKIVNLLSREGLTVGEANIALEIVTKQLLLSPAASLSVQPD